MVRVFLKKACDEECPTCKATSRGYQPISVKRDLSVSKETYQCQTRPITVNTCKATGRGYQPQKENNAEEDAGGGVIISLMLHAIKGLNPVYI